MSEPPKGVVEVLETHLNWYSWVPAVVGSASKMGDEPWRFWATSDTKRRLYSVADEGTSWRRRPTYADGVRDERARVVAWVRSVDLPGEIVFGSWANTAEWLANAIARGEHEKEG